MLKFWLKAQKVIEILKSGNTKLAFETVVKELAPARAETPEFQKEYE